MSHLCPLLQVSSMDPAAKWGAVALGVLTIIYAIMRPSFKKKKDPLARTPAATSLSQQRSVERQMQSLLVELSEMARQMNAQIDTRSAKLEALIQEADEKIAELKRLSNGSPMPSEQRQTLLSPASSAASSFERNEPAPVAPPVVDPRHAAVYSLADAGRSASDIAHELNRPRGEIDLILALRARN